MFAELTVILKDDEKTFRQKHAIHDSFLCDWSDTVIQRCVEEAKKNFIGEPTDIQVGIKMIFV